MENIIVIEGSITDGFTFYGPFETDEQAEKWAKENCINSYTTDTLWNLR